MKDYNNINIIETDRKGQPRITIASISFASFALLQLTLSIVFTLAVFIVLALAFHMISKMGLLDTINDLLGKTMVTYTESKLIMLSGMFAIMLGIIRFLYEIIHILLINATIRMIGGVPIKLYNTDSMNSKKHDNDNHEPRKVVSEPTIDNDNINVNMITSESVEQPDKHIVNASLSNLVNSTDAIKPAENAV